jgi:hypothetical protein
MDRRTGSDGVEREEEFRIQNSEEGKREEKRREEIEQKIAKKQRRKNYRIVLQIKELNIEHRKS